MSVLPAEVHTALASLLQGLQSPDNVQRTAAETQLNEEWVAQRPEVLLMGLSEQIELAQDTSVGHINPEEMLTRANKFVDANLRSRHLQAPILEAAKGCLRPDLGPVLDTQRARARGHPRKVDCVLGQRDRQLGPWQDRRCGCRAGATTHRRG